MLRGTVERGMVRCVEGVPMDRCWREEDEDCSSGTSRAGVLSEGKGSRMIGSLDVEDCGFELSTVVESWVKGGIGEVLARRERARMREMHRYMADENGDN